jgi:predicted HAD superfamily Cof-like phosphohydrolase
MGNQPCDALSLLEMVRHFHAVAGVPVANVPSALSPARLSSRVEWLREEVNELEAASTLVDQLDAAIDVLYLALGTLVEMGVELEEPFKLVHESNLAKAWPDGRFRQTATGKIIKPSGWQSPRQRLDQVISGLIARPERP